MGKIVITKEDKKEFRNTPNGMRKLLWQRLGMIIDIISTLSISLLNIFANYLPNAIYYYIILYILLVFVVIGGEFIGTYFGALEQYVLDKHSKKEINDFE